MVDSSDRQVLYANYGWRANRPPVAATNAPTTLTHTDLAVRIPLASVAQNDEGDDVFWRILGATHGTAVHSIATVSDTGIITAHGNGVATISVVYLHSELGDDGSVVTQTIAQSNVTLHVDAAQVTDDDSATAAPASVEISAAQGGVVSDATGETVMVGAGVLPGDTQVAIRRIDVAQLQATTDMPVPAPSVLETLGAFHLDIGDTATGYPLQAAIPVQAGDAQPGDEVVFLRKGTVMMPDGTSQPTWWLVDNGYVGADGIARTASPPYGGLDASGDYTVCRALPGVVSGNVAMTIGAGDWVSFAGLGISLAGGIGGAAIGDAMIGLLATSSSGLSLGSYHFGVPQFADLPTPQVASGDTVNVDVTQALPPAPSPYGNITLPNLTGAQYDSQSGKLVFTVDGLDSGYGRDTRKNRTLRPKNNFNPRS